jgi:hypothetical protein
MYQHVCEVWPWVGTVLCLFFKIWDAFVVPIKRTLRYMAICLYWLIQCIINFMTEFIIYICKVED